MMVVNKVAVLNVERQSDRHYKCDANMPFEAYNVVADPKKHTLAYSVLAAIFALIFSFIISCVLVYAARGGDVFATITICTMVGSWLLGSLCALVYLLRNHKKLIERLGELEDTLKNGLIAIPTITSIKQKAISRRAEITMKYTYLGKDGNTVYGEITFGESTKITELQPVVIAFCNDRTFVLKKFTLLDESIAIDFNNATTKAQEVDRFYRLDNTSYSKNICPSVPLSIFFKTKRLLFSGISILLLFSAISLVCVLLPVNPSTEGAVITLSLGIALSATPLAFGMYRLIRNIKLRSRFKLAQKNGYLALTSATRTDNEHVCDFGNDFYRVKVTCQFVDFEDKCRDFEYWVDSPNKKSAEDFGEVALLVHDDSIFHLSSYSAKFPLKKPVRAV